jgi:hypothetical protein
MPSKDLGATHFCVVSDAGIRAAKQAVMDLHLEAQRSTNGKPESAERTPPVLLAACTGLATVTNHQYPGILGAQLHMELSRKFRGRLTREQLQTALAIIYDHVVKIGKLKQERDEQGRRRNLYKPSRPF